MNTSVKVTTGTNDSGGRRWARKVGGAELLCILISAAMIWSTTAIGFSLANQPEPLPVNRQSNLWRLLARPCRTRRWSRSLRLRQRSRLRQIRSPRRRSRQRQSRQSRQHLRRRQAKPRR